MKYLKYAKKTWFLYMYLVVRGREWGMDGYAKLIYMYLNLIYCLRIGEALLQLSFLPSFNKDSESTLV